MEKRERVRLVNMRNQAAMAIGELQAVKTNLVKQFNRMYAEQQTDDAGLVEEAANSLEERVGDLEAWMRAIDKLI